MAGFGLLFPVLILACSFGLSFSDHCDKKIKYPLSVLVRKLPDPIVARKGNTFDASATLKVTRQLPTKFVVHFEIWKKILFWIKIPCIRQMGSCTYNFDCNELKCVDYIKMCTKCKIVADDLTFTFPIKTDFLGFIFNGHYWIGYKIFDAENNSAIACGEQYFRLAT